MSDEASHVSPASTSLRHKLLARKYEPLLLYCAAFSYVMFIIGFSLYSLLALYQRRSRQALKARPSERETIIAALDAKVLCIIKKLQYVAVAYYAHAAFFIAMDYGSIVPDLIRFSWWYFDTIEAIARDLGSSHTGLYKVAGLFIIITSMLIIMAVALRCNNLIEKIISLQVAALAFVVKRSASHDHLTSRHHGPSGSRISEACIIVQHLSTILSAFAFAAIAWIPWAFLQPTNVLCFAHVVIFTIVFRSAGTWLSITHDIAYQRCSDPLTAEIRKMFALESPNAADATVTLPASDLKKDITDIA